MPRVPRSADQAEPTVQGHVQMAGKPQLGRAAVVVVEAQRRGPPHAPGLDAIEGAAVFHVGGQGLELFVHAGPDGLPLPHRLPSPEVGVGTQAGDAWPQVQLKILEHRDHAQVGAGPVEAAEGIAAYRRRPVGEHPLRSLTAHLSLGDGIQDQLPDLEGAGVGPRPSVEPLALGPGRQRQQAHQGEEEELPIRHGMSPRGSGGSPVPKQTPGRANALASAVGVTGAHMRS